jgi:hypothetical protein
MSGFIPTPAMQRYIVAFEDRLKTGGPLKKVDFARVAGVRPETVSRWSHRPGFLEWAAAELCRALELPYVVASKADYEDEAVALAALRAELSAPGVVGRQVDLSTANQRVGRGLTRRPRRERRQAGRRVASARPSTLRSARCAPIRHSGALPSLETAWPSARRRRRSRSGSASTERR